MITINHVAIQSDISAVSYAGLSVTGPDGKPATLAIIDDTGNIIEAGRNVEAAVWNATVNAYRNFMIGKGHLRVHSSPPALGDESKAA